MARLDCILSIDFLKNYRIVLNFNLPQFQRVIISLSSVVKLYCLKIQKDIKFNLISCYIFVKKYKIDNGLLRIR